MRLELEPGEALLAGCDGRVTKKVEFTHGLSAPAVLRHQAPRDAVCVAEFKRKTLTGRLSLQFAEGRIAFEVNRQARNILAEMTELLSPCGSHA